MQKPVSRFALQVNWLGTIWCMVLAQDISKQNIIFYYNESYGNDLSSCRTWSSGFFYYVPDFSKTWNLKQNLKNFNN